MKLSAPGLHIELQCSRPADSEDWCRIAVSARVNGFRAEFEAWLQSEDLGRFIKEVSLLYQNIGKAGKATLESAEPEIQLVLTMHPLGGVTGEYRLESERREGTPTVLSGAFDIDQSYLPALLGSAQAFLEQLRGCNVP